MDEEWKVLAHNELLNHGEGKKWGILRGKRNNSNANPKNELNSSFSTKELKVAPNQIDPLPVQLKPDEDTEIQKGYFRHENGLTKKVLSHPKALPPQINTGKVILRFEEKSEAFIVETSGARISSPMIKNEKESVKEVLAWEENSGGLKPGKWSYLLFWCCCFCYYLYDHLGKPPIEQPANS